MAEIRKQKTKTNYILQRIIPYIGFIILVVLFATLTDFKSVSINNIGLIVRQSYVLLISATGVFFIMTMGGLDFSQGSIIGVASIFVASFANVNLGLAVFLGVVSGVLIGFINGFIHVKFKVASFIATICTMYIFRGLCAFLTTDKPVSAPLFMIYLNQWYILMPITLAVLIVGWYGFTYTAFGKILKAIGAGEKAARFSGINVGKTKLIVFTISGALTGLAAFINTIRVGSITASAGSLVETNIMIALVLGGMPVSGGARNKFSSVIVGVLLLGVLNNGLVMVQIGPTIQQLIRGFVFLIIVAVTNDRKSNMIVK